jgi:hypothetical protein
MQGRSTLRPKRLNSIAQPQLSSFFLCFSLSLLL